MILKTKCLVPLHVCPLPAYPLKQTQTNESKVFWQTALALQLVT